MQSKKNKAQYYEYINKHNVANIPLWIKELVSKEGRSLKILDVGCGTGLILKAMHDQFPKVQLFACDTQPVKQYLSSTIQFKKVNFSGKIPFKANFFDVVICTMVLEHLTDPLKLMNEIQKVLKPKGRVYLNTPHISSLWVPAGSHFFDDYTHVRPFSEISMTRLVQDAGLKVEKIKAGLSFNLWRLFKVCAYGAMVLMSLPFSSLRKKYYLKYQVNRYGSGMLECLAVKE